MQKGWRIETPASIALTYGAAKKIASQTETSRKNHRRLMRGIDPKRDPEAHRAAKECDDYCEVIGDVINLLTDRIHKRQPQALRQGGRSHTAGAIAPLDECEGT